MRVWGSLPQEPGLRRRQSQVLSVRKTQAGGYRGLESQHLLPGGDPDKVGVASWAAGP